MSALFEPTKGWGGNLDSELDAWARQPWYPAAQRIFTDWRDTTSPHVCTLAFARFLEACERAVARLQRPGRWMRSTLVSVPFLSNGNPVHHFRRRMTLADFGLEANH